MQRSAVVALMCASFLLLSSGCAVHNTAPAETPESEQEAPDSVSLKGTGRELGRGFVNFGLGWLEVPYSVEHHVRERRISGPWDVVTAGTRGVWGVVDGVLNGVTRMAGGVLEVVLSPFPPYGPIMKPPHPPYVRTREGNP